MEALLAALEATWWAQSLRVSRWGYAAVNTGHVLGLALLVGAIVPLDLRLLGAWRNVPLEALTRVLVPVAGVGLALTLVTGVLLLSIRASEYAALAILQLKLALVVVGAASALAAHYRFGSGLEGASERQLIAHGVVSLVCWTGALLCGRMIAFNL